ncbi:MAG: hypothetical protein KAJ18_10405 [Candidatus Omnitrophica bacterium]|nr:hypothetical protein [Candidatus Omnitrophota bacterium]
MQEKILYIKEKILENKITSVVLACLVIFVVGVICLQMGGHQYKSEEMGYEVTGPGGWRAKASGDKRGVVFYKNIHDKDGTYISLRAEWGNPYESVLGFLERGVLSSIKRENIDELGFSMIEFRNYPYVKERNDLKWAKASFSKTSGHLQVINVTEIKGEVFIFTLNSVGRNDRDERIFYKVIDSFVPPKGTKKNEIADYANQVSQR